MRFRQLDEILELQPGQRILARRTLRADEDYLRDHFPHFPVMPGVMMLESLYQAGMWLVRVTDQFEHPLVLLREARSVKFADFLSPGETLEIEVEWVKSQDSLVTLKAQGRKEGKTSLSARLIIEKRHLPAGGRLVAANDILRLVKNQYTHTFPPVADLAASGSVRQSSFPLDKP